MRLFKAIYVAILWYRVLGCLPNEEYESALKYLEKFERLGFRMVKFILVKSFVLYQLGDYEKATEALEYLDGKFERARGFSEEEKRYLHYYASILDHKISSSTGRHRVISSPRDSRPIRVSLVREHVKDLFPIS